MSEMTEREMLSAILNALETNNAKVIAISDELTHLRKDMNNRFDHVDSEFRHVRRRLDRLDNELDKAVDRIELLEGQPAN